MKKKTLKLTINEESIDKNTGKTIILVPAKKAWCVGCFFKGKNCPKGQCFIIGELEIYATIFIEKTMSFNDLMGIIKETKIQLCAIIETANIVIKYKTAENERFNIVQVGLILKHGKRYKACIKKVNDYFKPVNK